jgi:hypothetical protein
MTLGMSILMLKKKKLRKEKEQKRFWLPKQESKKLFLKERLYRKES